MTSFTRPFEALRRGGQFPVQPPSTPLPSAVLSALASIVRDMRDVPRGCIHDPAEMIHWLNRMARRVEGVAAMKAPTAPRTVRRPPTATATAPQALTIHQKAEAVFGTRPKTKFAPAERRTVTSRKGRAVPVEVRRLRAVEQMELGL